MMPVLSFRAAYETAPMPASNMPPVTPASAMRARRPRGKILENIFFIWGGDPPRTETYRRRSRGRGRLIAGDVRRLLLMYGGALPREQNLRGTSGARVME